MNDMKQAQQVMEVVAERSDNCERGVLFIDPYSGCGFALVAPDCVVFSQILANGMMVADVVLN